MKYLVIVESPSKCKKIEKYLNDNDILNIYEVVATMGHITELKSLKNINFEDNEMIYQDSYNQFINSEQTSNFEQQENLQNEWTN
jgi:DNA topoisomerase IA